MKPGRPIVTYRVVAAATLTLVVFFLICCVACGKHRGQVAQLTLTPPASEQPTEGQESTDGGVLPGVLELDALAAGTCKSVRSGTQVISFGADYSPDLSDTTSDREYSIEESGTSLNLRGYVPGDYAYALYGQAIGEETKPLQTLIDSEVCAFGGGQDDDIPLVYYLGLADYTLGTWRWYGPFIDNEPPYEDIDALITVNSETLKSRFTSPSDNFYLCVLTTNPSRATSSLSDEGLAAELPFEPRARTTSADELDPGGVRIEVVTTDTEEGLDTEPVVVTGLIADADEAGVTLTWDTNLDPNVDIYQVFRDDLDDEDPVELLQGVLAPQTAIWDGTGIPGKEYQYGVRARNDIGYGGKTCVDAIRELAAPTVTASDFTPDYIDIEWTAVEGAVSYTLYRGDTNAFGEALVLVELDSATTSYSDSEPPIAAIRWYWAQAAGEDVMGPLSLPDDGSRLGVPQNVIATNGTVTTGIDVSWDEVTLATSYNVYRSETEDDPAPTLLTTVAAPASGYSDTTAEHETLYWYCVSALYNADEGAKSADDSGYRGLSPPLNVQASDDLADTIEIVWDSVEGATGYEIYRANSEPGPYTQIGTDDASPYTDGPFAPDTTRWYKLKATNSLATSTLSAADVGRAPTWHIVTVDSTVDVNYEGLSLAVVNGKPAISYQDLTNRDLVYVRAIDGNGNSWETPVTADSVTGDGHVGRGSVLVVVNGNPAIAYAQCGIPALEDRLRYIRATDVNGDEWGTPYTVSDLYTGGSASLTVVNGYPAMCCYDWGPGGTAYWRADDANGDTWGSKVKPTSVSSGSGYTSLVVVNGRPAVSAVGGAGPDLFCVRAEDADGSTWGTPMTVAYGVNYGSSMAIVSGYPAIGYYDSTSGDLKYIRATDADGSTWGTPLTLDSVGDVGKHTSLAIVNGYPGISYNDLTNDTIKYVQATDANGDSWGTPAVVAYAGYCVAGTYTSLADVNGYPGISYVEYPGKDLKFAIYY